jgi:methyl-accepting chemotaxis protein
MHERAALIKGILIENSEVYKSRYIDVKRNDITIELDFDSALRRNMAQMRNFFRNISIYRKIRLGYIALTFTILIISVVSLGIILLLAKNQRQLSQQTSALVMANNAYGSFNDIQVSLRDIYINSLYDKTEYYKDIEEGKKVVKQFFEEYDSMIVDEQDAANFEALKTIYGKYISQVDGAVFAVQNGASELDMLAKTRSANTEAAETNDAFVSLMTYIDSLSDQYNQQAERVRVLAFTANIALFAIAMVVTLGLSNTIAKNIGKAIRMFAGIGSDLASGSLHVSEDDAAMMESYKNQRDEIGILAQAFDTMIDSVRQQAQAAQTIAEGDLTTSVSVRSEEDILGKALAHLVSTFHDLTASIIAAAEQVSSGARLVSDSSMTLSQGATEQASSIEELSASLEEITTSSNMNAQDAMQLSSLALDIRADADAGDARMSEMLSAMEEINTASTSIERIIKVIDDIAFQTNILALNAAVEAARAGQHGKGFAVVADEVRSLAGRSAQAVQETTELIERSISKVQAGMSIARGTAEALAKISDQIDRAISLLNGIATTSQQQARGVEQINIAIAQVSQVVQNTAAIAEEGAAASQELTSQAERLMEQTHAFKVRTAQGSALPAQEIILLTDDEHMEMEAAYTPAFINDDGKY